MNNIFKAAILVMLSALSINSFAKNPCHSTVESERADAMLDNLNDWDSIYQYYEKYSKYGCYSTGYFGESIADSVVKILANKWDTLDNLSIYDKKNRKFVDFILSKIDSTVSSDDLINIHKSATNKCPDNLLRLCKRIDREAVNSFKEMGGTF